MPIQIINFDTGVSGGAGGVQVGFENGDLTTGVYTFAHTLNLLYPVIEVYDNDKKQITPDEITAVNVNTASIDVSSFGAISGTWFARGVG